MKKSLPYLLLILLVLTGVGSGIGANAALRALVALPEGAAVAKVEGAASTPQTPAAVETPRVTTLNKTQYIEDILDRNLFDSDAAKAGFSTPTALVEGEVPTSLNVKLIGTLVAVPERFSSAFIAQGAEDPRPRGYGIGDMLASDAEIIKIETNRVTIKRPTGIEILTAEKEGKPAAGPVAAASSGDGSEGITKLGENKYAIEREVVDRYLGDIDSITKLGRALPHRGADGEVDGYRMSGIRRDSLGEKLGLNNGDIIHAVNGQPLTSLQGAMTAYGSLQSDRAFTFEVTRRGQKMTLEYEVR